MDRTGTAKNAIELPRAYGNYVLLREIAKGGMATIFLAASESGVGGARPVAIKQMHAHISRNPDFTRLFIEEAKLAAMLHHSAVVQVYDLGRAAEQLFIAMEYVPGIDLNVFLRELARFKVPLPFAFGLRIVSEVLEALDYAHRARADDGTKLTVVHRDVSPSNVLLSVEGEVKLCDFGIAKALDAPDEPGVDKRIRELLSDQIIGKSAYMSPEHARGEVVDERTDVFAAGILLWELSAGRRMYRGERHEVFQKAKAGVIPSLPSRDLPEQEELRAVILRALAKDPQERWRSAAAMHTALSHYIQSSHVDTSQLKFGRFVREHFGSLVGSHMEAFETFRSERAARSKRPQAIPLSAHSSAEGVSVSRAERPARLIKMWASALAALLLAIAVLVSLAQQ